MTPREMRHQIEIERAGGLYTRSKRLKMEKKLSVKYPYYLIKQAREELEDQRKSGDHCQFERFISDSKYESFRRKLKICDYYIYMDSAMVRYHKLGSSEFEIIKTKSHEEAIQILRFGKDGNSKPYKIPQIYNESVLKSPHLHINEDARKIIMDYHKLMSRIKNS